MAAIAPPPLQLLGASKDYTLDLEAAKLPMQVRFSPTGIIRSASVEGEQLLELRSYRDSYTFNSKLLQQRKRKEYGQKLVLKEIYNAVGVDHNLAAEAISMFWHAQIHSHMILPDAHLGWRVLLPMARGCQRSCSGCPEAGSFEMLEREQIFKGIEQLGRLQRQTHTPAQQAMQTDAFFDIADLAFLKPRRSTPANKIISLSEIVQHTKKEMPYLQNLDAFFGVPFTTELYRNERQYLADMCEHIDIAYIGVEAVPPINRIAFLKGDDYNQILALPAMLRELGVKQVIAIVQTGYEGKGIYTSRFTEPNSYMSAEEIILKTANLIADARFDGARISQHVTLGTTKTESTLDKLQQQGIIDGKTTTKTANQRTRHMADALRSFGITDIDTNYSKTISEFPYELAAKLEESRYGVAGAFVQIK